MRLIWDIGVTSWWMLTPLGKVIPHMPSLYNNPLYSGVGETPFQPATQTVYSIAENVTNKHQIIKVVPKNKICPKQSHLSYLIRALRTTTPVPRCLGQIYQCITPLEMSSSGQGRGWLNFCAKMASRSVRSPLKQTVLLVVLLIPLQGRSATKGGCPFHRHTKSVRDY